MSVTSTRRVSSSYGTPVKGGYETVQGRQSFVETIDTTNNVLVSDDTNSGKHAYYPQEKSEEESFEKQVSSVSQSGLNNGIQTNQMRGPLIDNDRDTENHALNRSVGIYGANQSISSGQEDRPSNPYLKHLYENNELIEDIDEFI